MPKMLALTQPPPTFNDAEEDEEPKD